ncbi:alpha/beta hydrolase [Amaricoccus sp.]|uniref:alpha/beta hydrolase n=1 Tax=Amaricoccus sp. TaxID=1872485 RepID=UPI001B451380|nr:alpha/beta hydrolase [Amaricoccus sp.]MBP7001782.1 alpha/beta hydrolase [Amaricoccus sp.]
MLRTARLVAVATLLIVPIGAGAQQAKEPITARSAVAALDDLKKTVEIADFRIGGSYDLANPEAWANGAPDGKTLESLDAGPLKTAYIAVGTPHEGPDGKIDNAIVISSFYSGDATSMYFNWIDGQGGNAFSGGPLIGPGKLFDTDRFYVVMVDALGLWGASKPSDGLGMDFPNYSYFDMVQANYRLLVDHLNVGHVVLATGVSMGATQSYVWGLMHPEFVSAVMPVGGATATDGTAPIAAWSFQNAKAGIEGDPVWQKTGGRYYDLPKDQHPIQGSAFHWSVLQLTGYDLAHRQSLGWDAVKGDVFAWDPPEPGFGDGVMALGRLFDAVDLKYRVEVGERHNINEYLPDYEPRTMVIHIENDQWLTIDKARESVGLIPGAQLATERSPIAHYAVFSALNSLDDDPMLSSFLHDIGILPTYGKVCDAPDYISPRVNMNPDPSKSFWKDEMRHPFPVKFTKASDDRGIEWEIGYFDVACPNIPDQKTLVVVHGKGAFASHYGYLIKFAVEQGYRVVALDAPDYGLSGPGNLGKNPARSLQDIRVAFHHVIVDQLGIDKAYYLGHSMGGQIVLGYALSWPEAVEGLILEGPAGLEEFPESVEFGGQSYHLFDPAIDNDKALWEQVWGPTGMLDGERSRTAEGVRDFFHFQTRDPVTGAVSPSPFGYFKRDTEYARLHTDQRVAMITGNPDEFEQWVFAFIFDVYSIGKELVKGDENSLFNRLPQIKAPIFLAFGAQEPFIPSTALNGLTDMANEVIIPFEQRMQDAGNPVETKLYPGVGHFIHTDVPYEFARDATDFMRTGRVNAVSPDVIDALVNGLTLAATAGGPGNVGAGEKPAGLSK